MNQQPQLSQSLRFLIGAACLSITLVVLQSFNDFVIILIVAAILGIVFTPLMDWLQKKGLPAGVALIITVLAVFAILAGLFFFFLYSLNQLNELIPSYNEELEVAIDKIVEFLASLGIDLSSNEPLLGIINSGKIVGFVTQMLTGIVDVLSDGVTVLLILVFLLISASGFSFRVEHLSKQNNPSLQRIFQYNQDIRHYISITNNVGMAAGVINAILLSLIGVDFAILWGVLSWLLSYIPFIGFLFAVIPPFILAWLEFGWATAMFVLIAYILINSAIDDFIKPRLMGKGLDLTPVIVFISVVFWGLILGPIGGILAVPVTLGIKQLILEPDPQNRWIAELISDKTNDGLTSTEK